MHTHPSKRPFDFLRQGGKGIRLFGMGSESMPSRGNSLDPQQRAYLVQDTLQCTVRHSCNGHGFSFFPVKASKLVGLNNPIDRQPAREMNVKGVSLAFGGNRTNERKAASAVVESGGNHQCRTPPRLLMSRLRAELQPDKIAPVRCGSYHASFPLVAPQSVSEGQFSGVIPLTSSSREHGRHTGRKTSPPSSDTSSSRRSPSLTRERSRIPFGMRTARLLPHREMVAVVFMFQPPVYPDDIQQ